MKAILVTEGGFTIVGCGFCDEIDKDGVGEDTGFLTRVDEELSEELSGGDNTGRAVPTAVDCEATAELVFCAGLETGDDVAGGAG